MNGLLPGACDSHTHVGTERYEPVEVLQAHLQACGIACAVLVQHGSQTDNSYLAACLARAPEQFAAVMRVPEDDEGTKIRHWAQRGFGGLRLRASARTPGADPLAQWRAANDLGLPVSVHGTPEALIGDAFAEVIATFPRLTLVLEHLGGAQPENKPAAGGFADVFNLARHRQIHLKLPGFGELIDPPVPFANHQEAAVLVDAALNAFGPGRMMWGSDWPRCCGREGLGHAFQVPWQHFRTLSDEDRAAIFRENARHMWFRGTRTKGARRE